MRLKPVSSFNEPFEFLHNSPDGGYDLSLSPVVAALMGTRDEKMRKSFSEAFYVCCLTHRWDSHLMWAHYASSHSGFVVVYDEDLLRRHFDESEMMIRNVACNAAPPSGVLSDIGPSILYIKPTEWEYEQEVRVVKVVDRRCEHINHRIPSAAIKGVN